MVIHENTRMLFTYAIFMYAYSFAINCNSLSQEIVGMPKVKKKKLSEQITI